MRWLLILWICFPFFIGCELSYCIVYIHIGQTIPAYVEVSLAQSRLFNPDCPIILIANERALKTFFSQSNITFVSCESLALTPEHEEFQKKTKLNAIYREGYWRYTSERFLYLYDYMEAFNVSHVFHIENDVLLYVDLGELISIFKDCYSGIATTFESESKCVPGFVFVPNKKVMQTLANTFAKYASKAITDMKLIALFWKHHKDAIDCLPMIMKSYLIDHTPPSFQNRLLNKQLRHSKCICQFNSIFDGAAIGVFLDGLDPAIGDYPPGYLMKDLFNPCWIEYKWVPDLRGRRILYALYGNEMYRINNLHIASKRLERFTSYEWPW